MEDEEESISSSLPGEEQNCSLREEIVHHEQLLVHNQEDINRLQAQYEELAEQVEISLSEQSQEINLDKDFTEQEVERQQELRHKMEEDLDKYKAEVALYQRNHLEQASIIDDLNTKVNEYRSRCSRLEEAFMKFQPSLDQLTSGQEQTSTYDDSPSSIEALKARLDQEILRCQSLTQINMLHQHQLDTALEANRAMVMDNERLANENQKVRSELRERETLLQSEGQAFQNYMSLEHHRLLEVKRHLQGFRGKFFSMKQATIDDLSIIKEDILNTSQFVKDTCDQMSFQFSITEEDEEKSSSQDATFLNQEIQNLKQNFEADKTRLNERIQELISTVENKQLLLAEKNKTIALLNSTIETVKSSSSQLVSEDESQLSKSYSRCCQAIKEIGQILLDDSVHHTWNGIQGISLTSIRAALLASTPHSFTNVCDSPEFIESVVSSVQSSFRKRCLQVEELNRKIATLKENIEFQQKKNESLDKEKHSLHQLTSKLSMQLDSVRSNMQDLVKEQKRSQSYSVDTESHKSCLEQIEKLNAENSRLSETQKQLYLRIEELLQERDKTLSSEQGLKMDLEKSEKKLTVVEENLKEVEEQYEESLKNLAKMTQEKEFLEQEKEQINNSLRKLERQRSECDAKLAQLQRDADSFQIRVTSLQNLNDELVQDKQALRQTLSETSAQIEVVETKASKERLDHESSKQEVKDKLQSVHQWSMELESQVDYLKSHLEKVEAAKSELEEGQKIIVQRNQILIAEVTKVSRQKSLLEKELEDIKVQMKARVESSDKLSQEREILARRQAELSIKSQASETELFNLSGSLEGLREDKDHLEKALFDSQQLIKSLAFARDELERELADCHSRLQLLQRQLDKLSHERKLESDAAIRQKDLLNQKIQQQEHNFSQTLKNVQQQRKEELESVIQEKEALRTRLEASREDLSNNFQHQIDDLIHKHGQELLHFQKKATLHEKELEDRISAAIREKFTSEKNLEEQKSALEKTIEDLHTKIYDLEMESLKEPEAIAQSEEYHSLLDEKENELKELKEEINDIQASRESLLKTMEAEIEELRTEKESALEQVTLLTVDLKTSHLEKAQLQRNIEDYIASIENTKQTLEQSGKDNLILQKKLSNEKKQVDLLKSAHEDYKLKLKETQSENSNLTMSLQNSLQKVQSLESETSKEEETNDIKNTLREIELSRIECRRELYHALQRLTVSETNYKSKVRELEEMHVLMARFEETETELRNTVFNLKQKIIEAEATRDATLKELGIMHRQLLDMEQKLKLQQEEHNASMQEAFNGELTHAEQRVGIERLLSNTLDDTQELRMKLNSSEGKLTAYNDQIAKLEGSKRDLETKMQTILLSLRSLLGLGSDSGFIGSTSQMLYTSPFSSQRESPFKLSTEHVDAGGRGSGLFRPLASSSTPLRNESALIIGDVDADLIRTALQDFALKACNTEKERDDLRMILTRTQRELEAARNKHEVLQLRLQDMQKQIDVSAKDKKELENQLSVSRSAITHFEDMVHNLESEKRKLSERNSNLSLSASSSEVEINQFQGKIAELRRSEASLKQDHSVLAEYKKAAEARAVKSEIMRRELEVEKLSVEDLLLRRVSEISDLKKTVDKLKSSLQLSEGKNRSLHSSVEHLNSVIEKYKANEAVLLDKLRSLEKSLSEATVLSQPLKKDLLQLKREHASCGHEKMFYKSEADSQRILINELRARNELLKHKVDELIDASKDLDMQKAELEGKLLGFESIMSFNDETGKSAKEKIQTLRREKFLLEEEIAKLRIDFSKNEQLRVKSEKQKHKFDKENTLLRKAIERLEEERQKTEEVATRSVLERTALGKSLTKMDLENQQLAQKVQNLQVQLVETEQRQLERIKEMDKKQKFDMQLEVERLRSTQKHLEELLAAKERTHKQKIIGLEKQVRQKFSSTNIKNSPFEVSTLQDHLQRAHSLRKPNTASRSTSFEFADDVFGDSYQKLPDGERLVNPLSESHSSLVTPTINITLPSEMSASQSQRQSTPQVRRRIDKDFPS